MNLNKFMIIGRLTRNPEKLQTSSGTTIARLNVAVESGYGEKKETVFLNVTAFGKLAEACAAHLGKGQEVFVEGKLRDGSYENREGKKVHKIDFIAQTVQFGSKPKNGGNTETKNSSETDDLPF